jgi:hypothetical protein
MASISKVLLQIFERAGSAQVQVSYTLTATHHDGPHEQAYRELVQLIGVDIGPGEDGVSEVLPGGTIWDGVVVFTTSQVAFVRSRGPAAFWTRIQDRLYGRTRSGHV